MRILLLSVAIAFSQATFAVPQITLTKDWNGASLLVKTENLSIRSMTETDVEYVVQFLQDKNVKHLRDKPEPARGDLTISLEQRVRELALGPWKKGKYDGGMLVFDKLGTWIGYASFHPTFATGFGCYLNVGLKEYYWDQTDALDEVLEVLVLGVIPKIEEFEGYCPVMIPLGQKNALKIMDDAGFDPDRGPSWVRFGRPKDNERFKRRQNLFFAPGNRDALKPELMDSVWNGLIYLLDRVTRG